MKLRRKERDRWREVTGEEVNQAVQSNNYIQTTSRSHLHRHLCRTSQILWRKRKFSSGGAFTFKIVSTDHHSPIVHSLLLHSPLPFTKTGKIPSPVTNNDNLFGLSPTITVHLGPKWISSTDMLSLGISTLHKRILKNELFSKLLHFKKYHMKKQK